MMVVACRPRACLGALALVLCVVLAAGRCLAGEDSPVPGGAGGATDSNIKTRIRTYPVRPATGPIRIDGVLDDPAWNDAYEISDFFEFRPGDGTPARVKTVCKITYDKDHIYFMARCFDPDPSRIRAHLTDRDNCYSDDYIGFQMDTFLDHRTGYEFLVNPLGVQADLALSDGGNEDDSFDCLWSSAARIDSLGWTAECAIPTKSIRFRNVPVTEWGFWIFRNYPREARYQLASHKMNRDDPCWECQFDHLGSLQGLTAGHNLEVLPYLTQAGELARPFFDSPLAGASQARTGLSLKYGFTPSMTLDATVNPDFAQVEADQNQISVNNASALFFSEKRPFFLEGNAIFHGQGNLFYSRNIADPDWAGKVTGRQGKLQVGVLLARDATTPLIMPYKYGSDYFESVNAPSTDAIVRLRSDLFKDSNIGFTGTSRTYDGGYNYLAALDGSIRVLPRWRWVWYAGLSETRDKAESQFFRYPLDRYTRPDGAGGFTTYQELDYSSRHYNNSTWLTQRSPAFRADLGYLEYNNVVALESWHEYDFYPNNRIVEFWRPAMYLDYEVDYTGREREHVWQPNFYFRLKHQWEVSFNRASRYIRYETTEDRSDSTYRMLSTQRHAFNLSVNKNGAGLVTGSFSMRVAQDVNRDVAQLADARTLGTSLNVRPSTSLLATLSGTFYDLRTLHDHSLVVKQELATSRITYQFSSRLFVRLLTQAVGTSLPGADTRRSLTNGFLLSYKLNYATVFFFGLNGDQENTFYDEDGNPVTRAGLTTAQNGAFAKFQYFWRL